MNWFRARRERREAALAAERRHQLELVEAQTKQLEVILESSMAQARESSQALIEVAKSNAAQAAAFTTWIESFKITEPPTSSVVAEDGEDDNPLAALRDEFPEEFKLAFELKRDIAASSPA